MLDLNMQMMHQLIKKKSLKKNVHTFAEKKSELWKKQFKKLVEYWKWFFRRGFGFWTFLFLSIFFFRK